MLELRGRSGAAYGYSRPAGDRSQPISFDIRSAWRDRADLHETVLPLAWLLVGLLASFLYMHGAAVTALLTADVPVPLFPPQAVILSVLLLTPPRRWWLYLLTYYAIQVAQGEWYGLPHWYVLLSNVANVVEPLVGALLLRHFIPLPRCSSACTR
jgi:hypothetical protein